jgi:hypothetical protein
MPAPVALRAGSDPRPETCRRALHAGAIGVPRLVLVPSELVVRRHQGGGALSLGVPHAPAGHPKIGEKCRRAPFFRAAPASRRHP